MARIRIFIVLVIALAVRVFGPSHLSLSAAARGAASMKTQSLSLRRRTFSSGKS